MKKTTKLVLAIGCLSVLTIAVQAQLIPLVNGNFEATTVKTPFFDSTGAIVGTVPGWAPTGTGMFNWGANTGGGDSGIDLGLVTDAPGGKEMPTRHLYLAATDPSVANESSTKVGLHIYELSFEVDAVWSSMGLHDTEVQLSANDDTPGGVVPIGTWEITSGDYNDGYYNVFVQSTLGSSYGNLQVSFQNVTPVTPGQGSYTDIDNVVLQINDAPEPGTLALLTLGGLSALVAIRRRS